jgi:hypothetical protein
MDHHEPPKGALLITVVYLILVALLWANVYLTALRRGLGGAFMGGH